MENTTTELAKLLKISVRQLQRLSKEWKEIYPGYNFQIRKGIYNAPNVIEIYVKYICDKERKKNNIDDIERAEALKIQEIEKAKKLIRERERDEGLYVEREKIINIGTKIIFAAKSRLLAIPKSVSRRLLNKNSQRDIHKILESEIFKGLDELSRLENI